MKLFFGTGLMVLMLSFFCSSFGYQSPRYVKLAREITRKIGKELKAEKNLYLVGTGGAMMNDIQMMAMSFDYYQEVDIKTGRQLIVYAIDKYLSAINSNQEIRPYLHEYPFTAKNVEIMIFLYKPDRSDLPLDKISYVTSINGRIQYSVDSTPIQAIHKETYEEALKAIGAG